MKLPAAILAGVMSVAPVQSMAQANPAALLMPSPLSIVLMVGRWMTESDRNDRVYHIRVQARGATESEARKEAYKKAIEEAIGSLVLSESVVVDERLRRREIIEYSSAYIDRYKIHDQIHDGRHFVVDMEVWVKHSAIADRLLVKSDNTQEIDGLRIQAQVESLNYERTQGVRVLSTVLADYPNRAYDIRNQSLEVKYVNRQAQINVYFDLDLNASYLRALWETLKNTAQSANPGHCRGACREPFGVHMIGRHDRVLFNRWEYSFGFNEPEPVEAVWRAMFASDPRVMMTMTDGGGRPIHVSCHRWAQLDGAVGYTYPEWQFVGLFDNNQRISIDGRNTLRGHIQLDGVSNIKNARNIDLKVVRGSSCPG